jgi:hypothetical protein
MNKEQVLSMLQLGEYIDMDRIKYKDKRKENIKNGVRY